MQSYRANIEVGFLVFPVITGNVCYCLIKIKFADGKNGASCVPVKRHVK